MIIIQIILVIFVLVILIWLIASTAVIVRQGEVKVVESFGEICSNVGTRSSFSCSDFIYRKRKSVLETDSSGDRTAKCNYKRQRNRADR